MNQKGIVLTGLIYALFTFFLLLLISLLTVLWYRQNMLNNLGNDANNIYDEPYIASMPLPSRFTLGAGSGGYYLYKNNSNYFVGLNPNNWIQLGTIGGNLIMWRAVKSDAAGIKLVYEGVKNGALAPTANGRITYASNQYVAWDDNNSNIWDNSNSNIKYKLDVWYATLSGVSEYIQPVNWCVGAVGEDPILSDFQEEECLSRSTPAGVFQGYSGRSAVGLINPSDYISTSASTICNTWGQVTCGTEGNFLAKVGQYSFWTLNALNLPSNVWIVSSDGSLTPGSANNSSTISIRPVINLSKDVLWNSGTGTLASPYTIK
ncbi:MAG: hypothetical protein WC343_04890 [Bacilli bacterium]|jgi:hypothetical protein